MATKIRLARHGHKDYAYYHIVVADSRAPRDGKFIERIGSYNPNTPPATVELNFERALYWVNVGAQPTDTARNLLSGEGVLLMKHLQGGVAPRGFGVGVAGRPKDHQRGFLRHNEQRRSVLLIHIGRHYCIVFRFERYACKTFGLQGMFDFVAGQVVAEVKTLQRRHHHILK